MPDTSPGWLLPFPLDSDLRIGLPSTIKSLTTRLGAILDAMALQTANADALAPVVARKYEAMGASITFPQLGGGGVGQFAFQVPHWRTLGFTVWNPDNVGTWSALQFAARETDFIAFAGYAGSAFAGGTVRVGLLAVSAQLGWKRSATSPAAGPVTLMDGTVVPEGRWGADGWVVDAVPCVSGVPTARKSAP